MALVTLGPLNDIDGMRHAFFTRQGGVSTGLYSSLNCGLGSGDDATAVRTNRARAMEALELPAGSLTTVYQVHGREVVTLDAPLADGERPKADALVTATPGVALGILTADCVPVVFCDPSAKVIGAAHAGWKGAIGGVLEATLDAMGRLGAAAGRTRAGIGPCIAQRSYEVGPEFPAPFLAENEDNGRFFAPARTPGKWMFDLRGYVADRLTRAGVGEVSALPNDTCGEADRFFSYRRSCLRGEADYGRGLSAIVLEG
ncbi:MAG: peptidoglycan editing factor PgeF [Alphaproteobacteria bacterium]|nr:peptidoglycan editing factor PgeF [Alphaproteobacteria bacterium]